MLWHTLPCAICSWTVNVTGQSMLWHTLPCAICSWTVNVTDQSMLWHTLLLAICSWTVNVTKQSMLWHTLPCAICSWTGNLTEQSMLWHTLPCAICSWAVNNALYECNPIYVWINEYYSNNIVKKREQQFKLLTKYFNCMYLLFKWIDANSVVIPPQQEINVLYSLLLTAPSSHSHEWECSIAHCCNPALTSLSLFHYRLLFTPTYLTAPWKRKNKSVHAHWIF